MKVGYNMNEKDFDLDFDFEKEYGCGTSNNDAAAKQDEGDEFDLDTLLRSEFGEEASDFTSEYESDFDYGPETVDYLQDQDMPLEGGFADQDVSQDAFDADLPEEMMSASPLPVEEAEAPANEPEADPEPQRPVRRERRKPVSPMRRFKNETLPMLILCAAALLIVVFVIGSVVRLISNIRLNNEASVKASEAAVNEAQRQEKEAQNLIDTAARLAEGYDYDGAIALLEGFTGNKSNYPEIEIRLSEYKQQKSTLIAHNDPNQIPNLSFHVLIADPDRAFSNREFGGQYNRNFVTIDEFERILDQLYINNYVLVDMDCFISETIAGETVTYSSKPLYLPDGKKPFMLTETMVNYFNYMIDSDGDGVADKDGAGFASRLVLQNGQIKAEMVNSSGETVVGNYDLVPILEDFIEAHPDFSYQGSRALLAVTGHEGIFGYRTNKSVIDTKGQAYYDEQVAGAKTLVQALRDKGYTLASYTYGNIAYGDKSATQIKADLQDWASQVAPVLGDMDVMVYARTSDIGDYSGAKFGVLSDAGFRYFVKHGSAPSAEVNNTYVRQSRLMVTGENMAWHSDQFSKYFDSAAILNNLRGNVPKS